MNKKALKYICLAQIASDAGKGIKALPVFCKEAARARWGGYWHKDEYIHKAIHAIDACYDGSINYWVHRGNGGFSAIIYFDIKVDGKRMQVSFHSKVDYKKLGFHGRKTRWDGSIGGSREACAWMIENVF